MDGLIYYKIISHLGSTRMSSKDVRQTLAVLDCLLLLPRQIPGGIKSQHNAKYGLLSLSSGRKVKQTGLGHSYDNIQTPCN